MGSYPHPFEELLGGEDALEQEGADQAKKEGSQRLVGLRQGGAALVAAGWREEVGGGRGGK